MFTTALGTALHAAGTAAEETRELPAPAWVFGVSALVLFAVLLGVTWAFRSVGTKH